MRAIWPVQLISNSISSTFQMTWHWCMNFSCNVGSFSCLLNSCLSLNHFLSHHTVLVCGVIMLSSSQPFAVHHLWHWCFLCPFTPLCKQGIEKVMLHSNTAMTLQCCHTLAIVQSPQFSQNVWFDWKTLLACLSKCKHNSATTQKFESLNQWWMIPWRFKIWIKSKLSPVILFSHQSDFPMFFTKELSRVYQLQQWPMRCLKNLSVYKATTALVTMCPSLKTHSF